MNDERILGTIVRKCFGTETCEGRMGLPGGTAAPDGEFAEIVSMTDEPTFGLREKNGHRYYWVQRLTRPATDAETIEYWKQRATAAEEALERPDCRDNLIKEKRSLLILHAGLEAALRQLSGDTGIFGPNLDWSPWPWMKGQSYAGDVSDIRRALELLPRQDREGES